MGVPTSAIRGEFAPYDVAADKLMKGDVDALIATVQPPHESIARALGGGARLLEIKGPEVDRLRVHYPLLRRTLLPRGTYPGQDVPLHTVGVDLLLVCRADLDTATRVRAHPRAPGGDSQARSPRGGSAPRPGDGDSAPSGSRHDITVNVKCSDDIEPSRRLRRASVERPDDSRVRGNRGAAGVWLPRDARMGARGVHPDRSPDRRKRRPDHQSDQPRHARRAGDGSGQPRLGCAVAGRLGRPGHHRAGGHDIRAIPIS